MMTIDTIRVECACGERAKLPPELAGRRVRCTSCKAKIRVPGPRVESSRVDRSSDSRRRSRQDATRSDHRSQAPLQRPRSSANRPSPYAAPKAELGQGKVPARPASKRSVVTKSPLGPAPARDRAGEAHIQAIGVWYRIYAVMCFAFTAFMVRNLEGPEVEMMGVITVATGGLLWWLGSSLMNFQRWARNVLGVCSAIGLCYQFSLLLLLPSGEQLFQAVVATLWLVATLWVLFGATSANVFREDYPSRDLEPIRWASSPFFWLPIAFSVGWFLIRLTGSLAFLVGRS